MNHSHAPRRREFAAMVPAVTVGLVGGVTMVLGAVLAVTTAVADATSVPARLTGGAHPGTWTATFAMAVDTLLLGALAHTGHAAARTPVARAGFAVAAGTNALLATGAGLPSDVAIAVPAQHAVAAILLLTLAVISRH